METKTITVVRGYFLYLRPRDGKRRSFTDVPCAEVVAASTDYQKLVDWYNDQLNPEGPVAVVCNDGVYSKSLWRKHFKDGSPIEWYAPASIELKVSHIDIPGIVAEWITMEEFNSMKKYFKDNFLTWIEED